MVDLRGDTYTLPTEGMRAAMASAPLGNDLAGEDPTVKALEQKAARMLGKEAALLLPAGTMANLAAILTHTDCGRGLEILCEATAHPFSYEAAGAASLAGVQLHPLPGRRGMVPVEDLEQAIREDAPLFPRTALVWMENTNNSAGGAVLPLAYMRQVYEMAHSHGLPVHLDGARLFNAAVALGVDVAELARFGDSVMFSLAKGLSAPAGAILAGSEAFIKTARRYKIMLGGGISQAGIIAAPGIVALDTMVQRLAEDHRRARRLAEYLDGLDGVSVDLVATQTNIVNFSLREAGVEASALVKALLDKGVKIGTADRYTGRAVVNRHVTDSDIEEACAAIEQALREQQNR